MFGYFLLRSGPTKSSAMTPRTELLRKQGQSVEDVLATDDRPGRVYPFRLFCKGVAAGNAIPTGRIISQPWQPNIEQDRAAIADRTRLQPRNGAPQQPTRDADPTFRPLQVQFHTFAGKKAMGGFDKRPVG